MKYFFILIFFIYNSNANLKDNQNQKIQDGEYIAESGRGKIKITTSNQKTIFKINTYGSNGSSCFVDGVIKENKCELVDSLDNNKPCILVFKKIENGLQVSATDFNNCGGICGARSTFEDMFYSTDKVCYDQEKKKIRKQFLKLYKNKLYDQSIVLLKSILDKCEKYISLYEELEIRNDLAVAYKNVNKKKECIDILDKFKIQANYSEHEAREGYPPIDFENFYPLFKKVKFNLGICNNLIE